MEFEIDEKYTMSIYHFNLQYKAGDVKSYHALHQKSMRPFLRFYERHPDWRMSCEIQGHYLKFMQKFYPEDLRLFRILNLRNQMEIVSVHYSDQIYLAYPKRDLQESININNEIFTELGLKRSGIWFGQENFFGPGIAQRIMEQNRFHTALLNSHYIWHHRNQRQQPPFWKFKELDHDRVCFLTNWGQSYIDEKSTQIRIQQRFSYWGDAELAFGATPYFSFLAKPIEQYAKQLWKYKQLEKEGYRIATVTEYINRVKELKLQPLEAPYLTDASWNTRYYQGVYLWMGTYRLPWEKDAELRSLTFRTRANLLATEKLINWAEIQHHPMISRLRRFLHIAWKHLLLAEVSDSTGQTPARIEIAYTLEECHAAENYMFVIQRDIKNYLHLPKPFLQTDDLLNQIVFQDKVGEYSDIATRSTFGEIAHFFPQMPYLLRINLNKSQMRISQVHDRFESQNRHYIIDLVLKPAPFTPLWKRIMLILRDGEKNPKFAKIYDEQIGNYCGIVFPLWENRIIYSPSCLEDELKNHPMEHFQFPRTTLPLPNGIIGIGNDTYIIKHNLHGNTHIGCTLNFQDPYRPTCGTAGFLVLNPPLDALYFWRFSLFRGTPQEVLDIGRQLNICPVQKIP